MAVNLITFSGSNVLPEYDAEARKGMTGFTTMPSVTLTGSNLLHITECYGMIAGYQFGIDTMDVAVSLPASGSVASSLYLHLDTSDIDTPLALTASATPSYVYGNGVYDMEIATFTATPSGVSGLTITAPKAISNTLIKRNTAYTVGDVVTCPSAPAGIMLQCTTAGTSAAVEPVGYQTLVSGGTVTDGTVIFTAVSMRAKAEIVSGSKTIYSDTQLRLDSFPTTGTFVVDAEFTIETSSVNGYTPISIEWGSAVIAKETPYLPYVQTFMDSRRVHLSGIVTANAGGALNATIIGTIGGAQVGTVTYKIKEV